ESERLRLIGMIPVLKRHLWFLSMTSSQALTQTVFGSLARHEPARDAGRAGDPGRRAAVSVGRSWRRAPLARGRGLLSGRTPAHLEGRGIPWPEPSYGGMQADGRGRRAL